MGGIAARKGEGIGEFCLDCEDEIFRYLYIALGSEIVKFIFEIWKAFFMAIQVCFIYKLCCIFKNRINI